MFASNASALEKFLHDRHPLTTEITQAVLEGNRGHTMANPTHLLMMLANTLEQKYAPGVEQANVLVRLAVALHDNPDLLDALNAKMEEYK